MRRHYDNDIEQFVQENADEYRMFPSEKVWKGVHGALHTRRKWYGLGLGFLLLLTGGAVTWVMMNNPAAVKKSAFDPITPATTAIASATIPKEVVMQKILSFSDKPAPLTSTTVKTTDEEFSLVSPETNLVPLISTMVLDEEIDADVAQNNFVKRVAAQSNEPAASSELVTNPNIPVKAATISARSVSQLPLAFLRKTSSADKNTTAQILAPYSIESVVNSYQFKAIRKKISWQFFVTPTISYRRLSVNKDYDNFADVPVFSGAPGAGPNYPFAQIGDVNRAVTHKPDLGMQVGLSGRYPLSRILKLRGGLQVNINRYDIKAFAYNAEPATINLNNGGAANSVSAWAFYRNYNGYTTDWLKNYYVSVSAPIGLELKVLGNKQRSFGIAGTIQPTYILKDRAFLISTDYKNYAEVPWLIRHTNVSSSFEAFVNFGKGKTEWQVGPQVRYQMLSSFHNKYPVKENLFDFGLKLGVSIKN